jgi:hypothetical protein
MSKELIDGEWKRNLNMQLLTNLLELDEPSISPKVGYLEMKVHASIDG